MAYQRMKRPPRNIKVRYKVAAESSEQFRSVYNRINAVLQNPQRKLIFKAYQRMKRPPRNIKVRYKVAAESSEQFRSVYNRINAVLQNPQRKLIFNDEPDKYFIGTLADVEEVTPGVNITSGELTFRCSDPRKYSLSESVFKSYADQDGQSVMTILNNGTLPVPIDFTITHTDENGYISISDGDHSLEYGDRIEPNEEERVLSEYAVRNWQSFNSPTYKDNNYTVQSDVNTAGSWQTDSNGLHEEERVLSEYAVRNWQSFNSPTYKDNNYTVQSDVNTAGSWQTDSNGLLYPYSYGEFASGKKWRGVSRSYELAKPAALPNMQNWEADWCIYHSYSKNSQRGLQWFGVLNSDNAMVCGVKIIKDQQNSMWTSVQFWVRGLGYCKTISTTSVGTDIAKDGRHIKITKGGDTFTFRYGGKDYSFVAPELAEVDAGKLYFSAYAMDAAANQMSFHIQGVWFRVDSSYMYDLPNRFSEGSVCEINGKTQEFSVNNSYRPEDELLGSEYFMAEPGITRLTFGFSSFCQEKPQVTARIREGWL